MQLTLSAGLHGRQTLVAFDRSNGISFIALPFHWDGLLASHSIAGLSALVAPLLIHGV